MELGRLLLLAAAVALAVARADGERIERICDSTSVCKCNGDIITCVCTKDDQILSVNPTSIPDQKKQMLAKFEVKDCHSLSFLEGAFKTASKLQTVHVTNTGNVTFNANVFDSLHTLVIDNVEELHMKNGAFEGVHGLNSIVVMKSHIPLIHAGALQNLQNLQEFKLSQVRIGKIEKGAIIINKTPLSGKIEILKTKIENIEELGVELGSNGTIIIEDNEIDKAAVNSLRIGVIGSVSIKGNTFFPDVNAKAANILYNKTIIFIKNTLLNVDISNAAKLDQTPEHQAIYNLDRLSTLYGGNYVNCSCINPETHTTQELKQNICNYGCKEATVEAFLKSCENNKKLSSPDILKALCKGIITPPPTARTHSETPANAPHIRHGSTTVKPGNGARENVVLVPLLAASLFHMIL